MAVKTRRQPPSFKKMKQQKPRNHFNLKAGFFLTTFNDGGGGMVATAFPPRQTDHSSTHHLRSHPFLSAPSFLRLLLPFPYTNLRKSDCFTSRSRFAGAIRTQKEGFAGGGGNVERKMDRGGGRCHREKKTKKKNKIWFVELFRFADGVDFWLMTMGSAGALVHGSTLPVFLRFFADMVNSLGSNAGDTHKMSHDVFKYALYFLVVGAAIWASSWAEISCWMWTGERQTTKMRIRYLEATLNHDLQYFDTEVKTSDVVFAINSDAVAVQDAISEKLGNFIHYMATFVCGFVVGFMAAWKLALVTIAVVPLIALIGAIHMAAMANLSAKNQEALSHAGNIVEQAVFQIRTVMSFVGETKVLQEYSAALRVAQKIRYKGGAAKGLGLGATYFTVFCCYALLLWYGGKLVRDGVTDGGSAISTMFSVMIGGLALGQSVPSLGAFAKAKGAAERMFRVIDEKKTQLGHGGGGGEINEGVVAGEVELKEVDFWYPSRPDVKVLSKFSLRVPAGKTAALVGSSGSGKSTVIGLIERFYEANSGVVAVDGVDVRRMEVRWLREQLGMVSQEPALFATSIRENILLGHPGASQEEVEEAAHIANAHSFIIKLPNGYDTEVGEMGGQLSGGQKQRVAIARAMLRNPAILLLDEATSALDSESERLVQEALDRFMVGRTTIIIAHRLSTIRYADLIAVLHAGAVSDLGSHDHLIRRPGIYSTLVRIQDSAPDSSSCNPRKSSARLSSARSSVGSPSMGRNSSYGRRISDYSIAADGSYLSHRQEKSPPLKEHAASFLRLLRMSSGEWRLALPASVGSVLSGFLTVFFAYVLSAVLSVYYNPDRSYMAAEIRRYCYLLLAASSATLVFNTVQHLFWEVAGEKLAQRAREAMLAAVMRNELAWFDREENHSSRLAARLSVDAEDLRSAVADRVAVIAQNAALMLAAYTVGFLLQWRLTLLLIAVFPVVVAATVLQKMFMKGFAGDVEGEHAKATQLAGEAIANVRTVAAFNSERRIVSLFSSTLQPPLRRSFWKGQVAGSGYGVSQFFLYGSYALGLWYASWLVTHGDSDFSRTIRVFMVLMVSANGAAETLSLAPDFIKGGRAVSSVFRLLDRVSAIDPVSAPSAPSLGHLRGDVELKHVDFSYPSRPDALVFRDMSLRARAGKTLALVGPSGCGKSSVIALVLRLYDPLAGRVTVDGKDVRKYCLRALRGRMAVVPQEACLFAGTVYDNIAYGAEGEVTETEVVEAAEMADAAEFIGGLPEGYRTVVGERGVQLSGGQRQRVAIARAVVRKADIVMLDEATSALDGEGERRVQAGIGRALEGRTAVVVAHRLWTVRAADRIAVVEDGRVAEEGTHRQLVKNFPEGWYARMVEAQKLSPEGG